MTSPNRMNVNTCPRPTAQEGKAERGPTNATQNKHPSFSNKNKVVISHIDGIISQPCTVVHNLRISLYCRHTRTT